MNTRTLALLAGLGLAAAACKDSTTVPELNNVSSDALAGGLTRSSAQLLVTGLLTNTRSNLSNTSVVFTGTMARDLYRLDANEQRFISETLGGTSDGSGFVGSSNFAPEYSTIRTANTLINGLSTITGLTAAEKAGTLGFAQTLKALAYYRASEFRDSLGVPLDVNHPIDDPAAPFVCKPNVLAFISTLLDSAKTNLAAGGSSFFFALPSGFSMNGDFSTPSNFALFARALKGKVELYRGLDHQKPNPASFATAITELSNSFLDVNGSMNKGLYNTYSTASGEITNPLSDPLVYLNPAVKDSIQPGDLRASKILPTTSRTLFGVTATTKPIEASPTPTGQVAPIAILKNSELILLRAQAEIETGDLASATADINVVRTKDGGLAPLPLLTSKTAAINAVLYEKRYSLLAEGPQRLVDLRAYGRLNATYFKKELPADPFQSALAIPKRELDARGVTSITPVCQ